MREAGDLRTYRFTARVTANGGVTPFEVGAVVTGTLTYDLRGKDLVPDDKEFGRYESKRNAISVKLGDLEFRGTGRVWASVTAYAHSEHFGVVAHDLVLPAGWDMDHEIPRQSYGVILQNVPSRQVLPGKALPDKVQLDDFKNSRGLRLNFFDGLKFPGGEVKGRATVTATVETLEEDRPVVSRFGWPGQSPRCPGPGNTRGIEDSAPATRIRLRHYRPARRALTPRPHNGSPGGVPMVPPAEAGPAFGCCERHRGGMVPPALVGLVREYAHPAAEPMVLGGPTSVLVMWR